MISGPAHDEIIVGDNAVAASAAAAAADIDVGELGHQDTEVGNSDEEDEKHGIFAVEDLVARRRKAGNRFEYEVKWAGWNSANNTWEYEENLLHDTLR